MKWLNYNFDIRLFIIKDLFEKIILVLFIICINFYEISFFLVVFLLVFYGLFCVGELIVYCKILNNIVFGMENLILDFDK